MGEISSFAWMLDEPMPWLIAIVAIGVTALAIGIFLWSFRVKRLVFLKSVVCPETKRRAAVELLALSGGMQRYHDVRVCSLLGRQEIILCEKHCLVSSEVRDAPYIIVKKL